MRLRRHSELLPETVIGCRKPGRRRPLSSSGASHILSAMVDGGPGQRGISIVEVLLALLVVGLACGVLYSYMGATQKSLEVVSSNRPIGHAKLVADLSTLAAIRNQLDFYASSQGRRPPTREALIVVLKPPPAFQCAGNDFTYDPASGAIGLVITDPAGCH